VNTDGTWFNQAILITKTWTVLWQWRKHFVLGRIGSKLTLIDPEHKSSSSPFLQHTTSNSSPTLVRLAQNFWCFWNECPDTICIHFVIDQPEWLGGIIVFRIQELLRRNRTDHRNSLSSELLHRSAKISDRWSASRDAQTGFSSRHNAPLFTQKRRSPVSIQRSY